MNPLGIIDLQHIGIPTRALEDSVAFYTALGFSRMEGSNSGKNCVFVRLGCLIVELYQAEPVAMKTGAIDHIAMLVKDIEAAWQRAKELGLRVVEREIQSLDYWKNGLRYFKILGPSDEILEFMQLL